MMHSVQYSALARLLSQNNRVHDLQDTLNQMPLPPLGAGEESESEVFVPTAVADLQEEIDREVRASLVTCWLGMPGSQED